MKLKIFSLVAIYAALGSNVAYGDIGTCSWVGNGSEKRFIDVTIPGTFNLSTGPIGSVIASSPAISNGSAEFRCSGSQFRQEYTLEGAEQAAVGDRVYKTGVDGVGIRFVLSNGIVLPVSFVSNNSAPSWLIARSLRADFIRTSREVASGEVKMNLTSEQIFSGWNARQLRIKVDAKVQSQAYFSGCTGVEKLNVALGRVSLAGADTARQKPFNLDVLCSGAAAGSKIPVKVYFEGDSDGPGRLNLEPGGAQGVEISLLNDRSVKLPFSQGSALDMTWTRSEPKGEVYRLPVIAEYAKKASQKVVPGRANATLNYILEYN